MPWLALLVVSALWGIHPVVGKAVEAQLTPLSLTVWRFTLCAVCYLPLYGRLRRFTKLSGKRLLLLAVSAVCWAILYPLFYYRSLRFLSPVESLLIVNTSPLLAAMLAWLLLRERLHRMEWLGILVSFTGVVLLVAGQLGGHGWLIGLLLAAVAAISFAGYTVSSRFLFQRLPLEDVLVSTSLFGAVGLWLITLCSGQVAPVAHALAGLTPSAWWQLAYIVVAVSTIAYVLYGYGLTRVPAAISSALTFYPQVVFTALTAWIWWGTKPSGLTIAAACFILGGTGIMRIRARKGEDILAEDETVYYFAYGSCMSPNDFARTVPEFRIEGRAVLPDYRLAFTRYSEGRMGGVADVVPSLGQDVEGILYRFPSDYLPNLDKREGVAENVYRRIEVKVRPGEREETAWTYIVVQKELEEIAPSDDYRDIILDGAQLLSESYRQRIREHMVSLQQADDAASGGSESYEQD